MLISSVRTTVMCCPFSSSLAMTAANRPIRWPRPSITTVSSNISALTTIQHRRTRPTHVTPRHDTTARGRAIRHDLPHPPDAVTAPQRHRRLHHGAAALLTRIHSHLDCAFRPTRVQQVTGRRDTGREHTPHTPTAAPPRTRPTTTPAQPPRNTVQRGRAGSAISQPTRCPAQLPYVPDVCARIADVVLVLAGSCVPTGR